jgi:COP9 signalosome complex subunit 4
VDTLISKILPSICRALDLSSMADLREQHKAQTDQLLSKNDTRGLQALWSQLLGDDVPQMVARQSTAQFAQAVVSSPLHQTKPEEFKDLCEHCLESIKTQVAPCDEAEQTLREALFDYYVGAEQFKDAANTLAALNLEGAGRSYTDRQKANVYVKIAEAFLQDEVSDCRARMYHMHMTASVSIRIQDVNASHSSRLSRIACFAVNHFAGD